MSEVLLDPGGQPIIYDAGGTPMRTKTNTQALGPLLDPDDVMPAPDPYANVFPDLRDG